jgi:hypothetical protein
MKHLLVVMMVVMVLIPFSQASGTTIGVTSGPLWTNTGIGVLATDVVSFTNATASWTYDSAFPIPNFGPEGTPLPGGIGDEWITNQQHGQLIGYIGTAANLNFFPGGGIVQNDLGLFAIGAGPLTETGRAGTLWLGFNDGFVTGNFQNSGTGSVDVALNPDSLAPTPEPATLLLLATSLAGAGAFARHRRKSGDSRPGITQALEK